MVRHFDRFLAILSHPPQSLAAVVFLFCGAMMLLGCSPNFADFSAFLGDWSCNRDLTIKEQVAIARSKTERDFAEKYAQTVLKISAEDKLPIHPNIRVTKSRMVGIDALLEPQYDILQAELREGTVIARVRYHEERHDQGDFSEITIHVRKAGENLVLELHFSEMPIPTVYVFERK